MKSKLPTHNHSDQLNELKKKYLEDGALNSDDIAFLFETIVQLEGELKEWVDSVNTTL